MIDEHHLQRTLARVAEALARTDPVTDVLHDLVDDATRVFDIAGAAISMADDHQVLRSVTASTEAIAFLEVVEERTQQGPCHEAHKLGKPVAITDLRDRADRWPDLAAAAERTGVLAAAGIPMHLEGSELGVLTLYGRQPRQWSERQIEAAQLLADTTTAYLVFASAYRNSAAVVDQLQHTLESRIIIEQAKGILANSKRISMDDAFETLRNHARSNNAQLSTVAHAVVELGLRL